MWILSKDLSFGRETLLVNKEKKANSILGIIIKEIENNISGPLYCFMVNEFGILCTVLLAVPQKTYCSAGKHAEKGNYDDQGIGASFWIENLGKGKG